MTYLISFAMVLGTYLGRSIPVNNMKYHLRDFKELLKENYYEVYIDPSPEGKFGNL